MLAKLMYSVHGPVVSGFFTFYDPYVCVNTKSSHSLNVILLPHFKSACLKVVIWAIWQQVVDQHYNRVTTADLDIPIRQI